MPVTMTKAQLNKLLVQERDKSRVKHQRSAFMRRTLSIYNGQLKRFAEWLMSKPDAEKITTFPYTLEEFRTAAERAIETGKCHYCRGKLTLKKLTPDHRHAIARGGDWALSNVVFCDQSCNWQKGKMDGVEFRRLLKFADKYLSPVSAADMKRRLSLGGKWSQK